MFLKYATKRLYFSNFTPTLKKFDGESGGQFLILSAINKYSSWGNDYLGQSDLQVCYKQAAINRYGMDELSAWVEMPMSGEVRCIDMEKRGIVADETIRQMILEKSGTKSLTDFRLHSKERQKDVVRSVMLELGAGPRQLSRVSGLSYSIVYKLKKS